MTNVSDKWINEIKSSSIREKLNQFLTDNTLTFDESEKILLTAGQGGMDDDKFNDLSLILAHKNEIFSDEYVKSITDYVVNGNPANSYWWGGLDKSEKSVLGNLHVSSSQNDVQKLVDKWFSGTDEPLPIVGGDTAAGISGDFEFSYSPIAGKLFVDGVSASDIHQGMAGTCYYLAALGSIANANPSLITDEFIHDNQDGTYGVRFFNVNGEAFYVTVDTNLATDDEGNLQLAQPDNSELWVSLSEKAYAQLNAQTNVLLREVPGLNSYQAVEGGNAEVLKQITGLNYRYYSGDTEWVFDSFSTQTKYSIDPNTYKEEMIQLLNSGSMGWFAAWIDTYDANGKQELVNGHAFMLLGYDAKTDTFQIRNPWGGDGSSDYNVEFNLPIEKFWNNTYIALTDATLKNAEYEYTITSESSTKDSAAIEGNSVNFTIERNDLGTGTYVYYSIRSNATDASDLPELSKVPVLFLDISTTQNLSIPIFTDSLKEGIESFDIELYKSLEDTVPYAKLTNYIKDADIDTSTYTATVDNIVEGQKAIVTIERDNAGTETTVFLNTVNGKAESGVDFEGLNRYEVTFKANQKVATVELPIYSDLQKDNDENFELDLYKYYSDVAPNIKTNVIIKEAEKAKDYSYTISSDANSEAIAKDEGSFITFTVKRDSTGTESTVYLKNGFGAALAGVDYSDSFNKELTFAPNQDTLTFSVETLADDQLETTEVLNVELYKVQISDMPDSSASAYIKNNFQQTYNYTITSTAATNESAVEEGHELVFTITRDGSESESTIYVDTFDGSAVGENQDWTNDYEPVYEQKLIFAPGETSKDVIVNTYGDSNTDEGVEELNLGFYQYKSDVEYSGYATAYLTDTIPDNYSYEISGDNVIEGEDITFTITRNNQGTQSTVYLWTIEDIATVNDFGETIGEPLTFAADETVKTVTVKTIKDDLTDEPVYEDLFLCLYKYFDDQDYSAYGDAWIVNELNQINGTKKADSLLGTVGQDEINGMAGNDKITGGENQDVLSGGAGNDMFIYKSITDTLPNLGDIITDFSKGDKINLKLIDANVDVAKDQAFSKPSVGKEFSGTFTKAGQLFFETSSGMLYGNVNKDGAADFEIELSGVSQLVTTDFVL